MRTTGHMKHWQLRRSGSALLFAIAGLAFAAPALADQEASNVAHVVAGPYGRCYAKSVPAHIYDPEGEPRQQGHTTLFRVGEARDVVEHRFDWFSQKLFLRCRPCKRRLPDDRRADHGRDATG